MSTGERKAEHSIWVRARDLAVNVLIFAAAQILLALLFWQLFFRSHPQGFAMGLTLVGFASWVIAFVMVLRRRHRRPGIGRAALQPAMARKPGADAPATRKLPTHLGSAGCGTILLLSGLVSLALAFTLRVRADMQAGMTWSDIFPTAP
jgi:hypothetical protein